MIYDKLLVALMSMVDSERRDTTDAHIARTVLRDGADLAGLSVAAFAERCHVGTGSVSRFCRQAGLSGYAELQQLLQGAGPALARVEGKDAPDRGAALARRICQGVADALASVDPAALSRLAHDIRSFERVHLFGMLKAQAAATNLQVDLLAQGLRCETSTVFADQVARIRSAGKDNLFVIFSYTGTYFDATDLEGALRRLDRPRIWLVCGALPDPMPSFVADVLTFSSALDPLAHPYQLEAVASLIAQEVATHGA